MQLLLAAGADLDAATTTDGARATALHMAAEYGHLDVVLPASWKTG